MQLTGFGRVTARPNGVSVGVCRAVGGGGGLRGEVRGWSQKAAARHVRFLQSVDPAGLTGFGLAVTLTVRDLPTPDQWKKLRVAWLRKVRGRGAIRFHWVVEWQKRGVPHIHASVYFPEESSGSQLLTDWVTLASKWGAELIAQDMRPIDGAVGWWRYQAKHSSRSAAHYQRRDIPASWASSGRMWGKGGDWPTCEEVVYLNAAGVIHYRRLVRSYAVSVARTEPNPEKRRRALSAARTMLKKPLAGVREWCPEEVHSLMLAWVVEQPGVTWLTEEDYHQLQQEQQRALAAQRCPPLPPAADGK